jgi:hypothetical protein
MKRSLQEQGLHLVSILFAAIPFAFALVRAVRTGYGLRYLWMAVASLLGATAVLAVGKARSRKPNVVLALAAGALVIATLLAGWAPLLLEARAAPGIWVVAFGFGLCCAVSRALDTFSRPRTI